MKINRRLISGLLAVALLVFLVSAMVGWGPFDKASPFASLADALVYVSVLPFNFFPIGYAKWFPFWKTNLGRAMMLHMVGMALLVDFSIIEELWLGYSYPGRNEIQLFIILLVVGGVYYWALALYQIRQEDLSSKRAQTGQQEKEVRSNSL